MTIDMRVLAYEMPGVKIAVIEWLWQLGERLTALESAKPAEPTDTTEPMNCAVSHDGEACVPIRPSELAELRKRAEAAERERDVWEARQKRASARSSENADHADANQAAADTLERLRKGDSVCLGGVEQFLAVKESIYDSVLSERNRYRADHETLELLKRGEAVDGAWWCPTPVRLCRVSDLDAALDAQKTLKQLRKGHVVENQRLVGGDFYAESADLVAKVQELEKTITFCSGEISKHTSEKADLEQQLAETKGVLDSSRACVDNLEEAADTLERLKRWEAIDLASGTYALFSIESHNAMVSQRDSAVSFAQEAKTAADTLDQLRKGNVVELDGTDYLLCESMDSLAPSELRDRWQSAIAERDALAAKLDEAECTISNALAFAFNMRPDDRDRPVEGTLDEELERTNQSIKRLMHEKSALELLRKGYVVENQRLVGSNFYAEKAALEMQVREQREQANLNNDDLQELRMAIEGDSLPRLTHQRSLSRIAELRRDAELLAWLESHAEHQGWTLREDGNDLGLVHYAFPVNHGQQATLRAFAEAAIAARKATKPSADVMIGNMPPKGMTGAVTDCPVRPRGLAAISDGLAAQLLAMKHGEPAAAMPASKLLDPEPSKSPECPQCGEVPYLTLPSTYQWRRIHVWPKEPMTTKERVGTETAVNEAADTVKP